MIPRWARRITPESRTAQLLAEARMAELEHRAAAEHHKALADMYAARVARLESQEGKA